MPTLIFDTRFTPFSDEELIFSPPLDAAFDLISILFAILIFADCSSLR